MTEPVTVIVQARMGSTRLPGKVLMRIGDQPLLRLMLARLQPLIDGGATVVVATSDGPGDDPLVEEGHRAGAAVVRGSESDVLDRMLKAAMLHPAPTAVRLTADCPLIDPEVVAAAVALQRGSGADYVSNSLVRTFPDGLDVEVLTTDALRAAADEAVEAVEREHVTPFLQRRPHRFLIGQLTTDLRAGSERWTVDDAEDLDRLREMVLELSDPMSSWTEILRVAGRRRLPLDLDLEPMLDLVHERGCDYVRGWTVVSGQQELGEARVIVTDTGRGTMELDVEDNHRDEVGALVRRALAADLQIADLDPRPMPPGGPHEQRRPN